MNWRGGQLFSSLPPPKAAKWEETCKCAVSFKLFLDALRLESEG